MPDLSADRPSFTDEDLAAASSAVANWCKDNPANFEPVAPAMLVAMKDGGAG